MIKNILFLTAAAFLLFSCGKDEIRTRPAIAVKGTWSVVNTSVQHNSTKSWKDGEDSITIVENASWTTYMNQGNLVIDDSSLTFSVLKYNMNFVNYSYTYLNTTLNDSSGLSFAAADQRNLLRTAYKRIDSDSLYVGAGFSASRDSFYYPVMATGARVLRNNDTLYLLTTEQYTMPYSQDGIPAIHDAVRTQTMKFIKKH